MSAPVEVLSRLLWIRDAAALPDAVVADQLQTEVKVLAALVQAHPERFSESLVFRLNAEERQRIPEAPVLAFTEAGAALLVGLVQPLAEAALLKLLPAFAEARHVLTAQVELAARIGLLEQKMDLVLKTLQGEGEADPQERPIGFVIPEQLPHALKASQRTKKAGSRP